MVVGEQLGEHRVAEHPRGGSPPVPTSGLVIVSDVWWLNTITSRSVDAASVALSQSNWAWSIEPSAYPLGLTVSSTTNRHSPLSKV